MKHGKKTSKINNNEKQIAFRKLLYDLSTGLDVEEFNTKLHTFISNGDEYL